MRLSTGILPSADCLLQTLMTGFKVQPVPIIGPSIDNFLTSIGMSWITTVCVCRFTLAALMLIVVGVAMDTVQQVEAQLIMRHYEGFMKRERMRGRRG